MYFKKLTIFIFLNILLIRTGIAYSMTGSDILMVCKNLNVNGVSELNQPSINTRLCMSYIDGFFDGYYSGVYWGFNAKSMIDKETYEKVQISKENIIQIEQNINNLYKSVFPSVLGFCMPQDYKKPSLSSDNNIQENYIKTIRGIYNWIDNHPESQKEGANILMLEALHHHFPCSEPTN